MSLVARGITRVLSVPYNEVIVSPVPRYGVRVALEPWDARDVVSVSPVP